ncbi:MAG: hypothetical protein KatS3mg068_1323 [Candidatus Sericytochromatia bacterium]|nr:MAG: hypothetical protein KatS3mg068_1323 [Candidatus Sericytochromatia bacterium]
MKRIPKTPQFVDATTAICKIKKGKRIFIGSGCAEPNYLVKELVNHSSRFSDNEIVHLLTMGNADYASEKYQKNFRHNAFFIGNNVRKSVENGLSDYTPIFLSEIPKLINSGFFPIHCAIVQTSLPDNNNILSLGISVDIELSAILNADIVIAQVNKYMPKTFGKSQISIEHFDYLVRHDEPLIEIGSNKLDDVSLEIGKNISKLIKDRDTLQLGIGKIPDAVLLNLTSKKDLGIHTEMFSNGIIPLYKNGNITNSYKNIHKGKSVTSFIMGNKELYDLVDNNEDFLFLPSDYVNDPFIIASNNNMVSINSALEVDLTGQVCADSIGTRFFSGIGGQVDFVRGAKRSIGGRSFIALPSTAKNGSISRIVSKLSPGAGVVTSRGDVDYVVTEYGVAHLYGKTIRERGLALIQIAHPDFRQELLDYMKEKHYVYLDQKTITKDIEIKLPSKKFKDFQVYFRYLLPSDEKEIQEFFYNQNREAIYHTYKDYIDNFSHDKIQNYINFDEANHFVIGGFDSQFPYANMICLARYSLLQDAKSEINLIVDNDFCNKGIGSHLIELIIKLSKSKKIKTLIAKTDYSNIPMLKLLEKYNFKKVSESNNILTFSLEI